MRWNKRWVGALVAGAACALAGSCGGAGPDASQSDASADAPHADASPDADADGCSNDFDFDASTLCCSTTVAEGCKHDQHCIPKWPGDARAFCSTLGGLGVRDCNGYHVVLDQGVDTGSSYYYDTQTGALVAIEDWNANYWSLECAGPSTFTRPACSGKWTYIDCRDAGADAAGATGGTSGTGGAGGVAATGGMGGADAGGG